MQGVWGGGGGNTFWSQVSAEVCLFHMIYSFGMAAPVYYLQLVARPSRKPCEVKVVSAAPGLGQRRFAVGEHLQLLGIHPQRVVVRRRISGGAERGRGGDWGASRGDSEGS